MPDRHTAFTPSDGGSVTSSAVVSKQRVDGLVTLGTWAILGAVAGLLVAAPTRQPWLFAMVLVFAAASLARFRQFRSGEPSRWDRLPSIVIGFVVMGAVAFVLTLAWRN